MTIPDHVRGLAHDVQVLGVTSAASVVARYVAKVEKAMATEFAENTPIPGAWTAALLAGSYLRLAEAWAQRGRTSPGEFERVTLPPSHSGSSTTASVWLHGGSADLVVTATDLFSSTGGLIPCRAVSVSPVEATAADAIELRVRVDVPDSQPPGHYHGWVMLAEAAADPVAISLLVTRGNAS